MDGVYCFFAGNRCTFDEMMDLASTFPSQTWKYHLGVAGMGFIMLHYVRPTLYPLVAILEDKMVLVGRRQSRWKASVSAAVSVLFAPFGLSAWYTLVLYAFVLFALWIWSVWRSAGSLSLSALAHAVIAEPASQSEAPIASRSPSENRRNCPERPVVVNLIRVPAIGLLTSSRGKDAHEVLTNKHGKQLEYPLPPTTNMRFFSTLRLVTIISWVLAIALSFVRDNRFIVERGGAPEYFLRQTGKINYTILHFLQAIVDIILTSHLVILPIVLQDSFFRKMYTYLWDTYSSVENGLRDLSEPFAEGLLVADSVSTYWAICGRRPCDNVEPNIFLVSEQLSVRYHMAAMKACGKFARVEWHSQTFSVSWYLNAKVSRERRQAIDRELARLRLDNVVQSIIAGMIPATCRIPAVPLLREQGISKVIDTFIFTALSVFLLVFVVWCASWLSRSVVRCLLAL